MYIISILYFFKSIVVGILDLLCYSDNAYNEKALEKKR